MLTRQALLTSNKNVFTPWQMDPQAVNMVGNTFIREVAKQNKAKQNQVLYAFLLMGAWL